MNISEEIVRIAAKGDGITASGRHMPGTAPGDAVAEDGTILPGAHRVAPACRHFGTCGGCQLQHLDEETLASFVSDRVLHAAQGQGLEPEIFAPAHLSPPESRRRATLHASKGGGRPQIGFREKASHTIVDLAECPVLAPDLFKVLSSLRAVLARRNGKLAVDVELALTEQGVDVALKGLSVEGLAEIEAMLAFARDNALARLVIDQGYGPEVLWEPEPVTVQLSGVSVPFPSGSFLQATEDGEAALVSAACDWLGGARTIADLFAGLGTFAFALAGPAKVLAVEAAQAAYFACKAAAAAAAHAKPVHAMHRDLFRNPLQLDELNRFDAVLLDPPRAGARDQIKLLAQSSVQRIVYISCNPSSWARDAKQLAEGGYRLVELRPVGQFRWSTHVELASLLIKS
jgi:23S rRNA (uracil1939-C5)-methyltransferase